MGGFGDALAKIPGAAALGGGGEGPLDKVVKMLKEAAGKIGGVVGDFKEKCNPDKLIHVVLPKIPVTEEQLAAPSFGECFSLCAAKWHLFFLPLVYIVVAILIKAFASPVPSAPDYEGSSIQWLLNLLPILTHFVATFLIWLGLAQVWLDDIGDDVGELKGMTDGKKGEVAGKVNKITGLVNEQTKPVNEFVKKLKADFKPAEDKIGMIEKVTKKDLPSPDDFVDPVVQNITKASGAITTATKAVLDQLDKLMPSQLQPKEYWFNDVLPPRWCAKSPMKVLFAHIPLVIILLFELIICLLTHIGNYFSNPFGGQIPSSASIRALRPLEEEHGWALSVAFASAILAVALTAVTLSKSPPEPREGLEGEEQPLLPPPALREGGMTRRYLMMATLGSIGMFSAAFLSIFATSSGHHTFIRADAAPAFNRMAVINTELLVGLLPAVVLLIVNILLFFMIANMTTIGALINWANRVVVGGFEKEINNLLDEHLLEPVETLYNFVTENLESKFNTFSEKVIPILEEVAMVPGL